MAMTKAVVARRPNRRLSLVASGTDGLGHAALPQPVGVHHAHEQGGHVVEHDGDDHFVLAPVDLEKARDQRPQAAGESPGDQAQDDGGETLDPALGGHVAAGHGADDELALAAQVEHAAAVGKAGAKAGEDQGRCPGQRGAHVAQVAEGAGPQGLQRRQGIGAQEGHDRAADGEGQQHGDHRHQHADQLVAVFHIRVSLLTCRPWPD